MQRLLRDLDSAGLTTEAAEMIASAVPEPERPRFAQMTAPRRPDAVPSEAGGFVPPAATAIAEAYREASDCLGPAVPGQPRWRELGPWTIPGGQTYGSGGNNRVNVAGRVSCIAIDPTDITHLLCGSAAGGV